MTWVLVILLALALGLNVVIVVVQVVIGFAANSLGLLSDAGHNLTDVAALGLSLVAMTAVRVGRPLALALPAEGPVGLFAPGGEFLALYRADPAHGDLARPVAVFV